MWWPFSRQPSRLVSSPVEQARDSLLNKASKLDLAERAVMLDHLREVASDEVDSVRRLRARHLGPCFAGAGEGEEMGDIIVGDDVHIHERPGPPPPSRAWPVIAGLTLGGSLIAAGLALPQLLRGDRLPDRPESRQPAAQPEARPPINTTIEKRSGFIIDLPGGN